MYMCAKVCRNPFGSFREKGENRKQEQKKPIACRYNLIFIPNGERRTSRVVTSVLFVLESRNTVFKGFFGSSLCYSKEVPKFRSKSPLYRGENCKKCFTVRPSTTIYWF